MNTTRSLALTSVLVASLFSGCGTNSPKPYSADQPISTTSLLSGESLFATPIKASEIPNEDPMALPPEIHTWFEQVGLNPNLRSPGIALVNNVNGVVGLGMTYDPSATLNVTETFRSRSANCLSYSMLIYALAKELGLDALVQLVDTPPNWDFIDNRQLKYNRHVNVRVSNRTGDKIQKRTHARANNSLTGEVVNFSPLTSRLNPTAPRARRTVVADINMPEGGVEFLPTTHLSIDYVIAQYFNNVAAEYLFKRDERTALAYINRALQHEPNYSDAWVNIGVIYRRSQLFDHAEAAYQQALAIDADSFVALSGLRSTYQQSGQIEKAEQLAPNISRVLERNPYHHYQLARQSLQEPEQAYKHITKALALRDYEYRFYHLKSLIELKLGDTESAYQSLLIASRHAGINSNRFQGKADALNQLTAN